MCETKGRCIVLKIELKKWMPIALCCVPAVAIAAVVGMGIAIGGATFGASFGGPLGLGLVALALLVCPLHMGWMMWRMQKQSGTSGQSVIASDCCPPVGQIAAAELDTRERLHVLRQRREALEQEMTVLLQTYPNQTSVEQ